MFCVKCGTQLPDGSSFCNKCGSPVAAAEPVAVEPIIQTESPPQQPAQRSQPLLDGSYISRTYQAARESVSRSAYTQTWANDNSFQEGSTHPYQQLGGWLMFFVYAPLVGIGLLAIAFLFSFFTLLPYIPYIGPMATIIMLIELAGYGVSCFYSVKFSMMLKNKNPGFLRFYELAMIVLCAIYIIVIAISGFRFAASSIRAIMTSVLGFILATLYFRKSVRVHIYMGNDDYLLNSIFSKNAVAPNSSEIKQYASSQADTQRQYTPKEPKRSKPNYYTPGKKTYERRK